MELGCRHIRIRKWALDKRSHREADAPAIDPDSVTFTMGIERAMSFRRLKFVTDKTVFTATDRLASAHAAAPSIVGTSLAVIPHGCSLHEVDSTRPPEPVLELSTPEGLSDQQDTTRRKFSHPLSTGFAQGGATSLDFAVDMGAQAMLAALSAARIRAAQVDAVVVVSNTVPTTAGVDLRIATRVGLRNDIKRLPLLGVGCAADTAGLSCVHDYLRGYPNQVAAMLSVELRPPSTRPHGTSVSGQVEVHQYGNGIASVIVAGAHWTPESPLAGSAPKILATRSHLVPDTIDFMSFKPGRNGFQMSISQAASEVVGCQLVNEVESFLADHGLTTTAIDTWISHPGDLKTTDWVAKSVGLPMPSTVADGH